MAPRTRKSPSTDSSAPHISAKEVSAQLATPVRALGTRSEAGYLLLRDVDSQYRDGSEERILQILQGCTDVSANSVEALAHARDWAERYHTTPARANVIRDLALPTDAIVLEIGAGCGAVTRYLGENCAVVDALEPVPARAAAATERCRDLPQVQVLVGELDDLPAQPTYDVVVVVGVLEYVGSGTDDLAPYQDFLAGISARLNPSGSLVLAIENKLGVKYLVGAPEDHSGRVFDSLEGYPHGSPARTFSRLELESLVEGAGLTARTALAFPDYKLTRTVLRPQVLPKSAQSLLYRVPNFPSPDWLVQREHMAEERLLWKSLVEAGLALESGNSFVVVAGKDGVSPLWDETSAGTFYSQDRQRQYMVRTELRVERDSVTMVRQLNEPDLVDELGSSTATPSSDWTLRVNTAPFVQGTDFMSAFVDVNDAQSVNLLRQWSSLVTAAREEATRSVDLVPHNLIVAPDGSLIAIDEEWHSGVMSSSDVLRRGALLFALRLAEQGRVTAQWEGCGTFADIAQAVAEVIGVGDEGWLDSAARVEADFLNAVTSGQHAESASRLEDLRQYIIGSLDRGINTPADFAMRLEGLRQSEYDLSMRLHSANEELAGAQQHLELYSLHVAAEAEKLQIAMAELDRANNELVSVYREKQRTNEEVQRLRRELLTSQDHAAAILASKSYRATKVLRVIRGKLSR